MKNRSTEILQTLLSSTHPRISIEGLSKRYSVSERTLYNDIEEINRFLRDINMPYLYVDENKYIIIDPSIQVNEIQEKIENLGAYLYKLSPIERQTLIVFKLLSSKISKNDERIIRGIIRHTDDHIF